MWCDFPIRAAGSLLGVLIVGGSALAADPPSGTLSPDQPELTYTVPPQPLPNASGAAGDYVCDATSPCDDFALTVALPADWATTHPNDRVRIDAVAIPEVADIDMYLLDPEGEKIQQSRSNPPTQESIAFAPGSGTSEFTVRIFPGTPGGGAN